MTREENCILIVDDEEDVTSLFNKIFTKEGYRCYEAGSAELALKIIDCQPINIVITDIKMPGMSGIELLEKIGRIDSSIKVIVITAFATLETAIKAVKCGALDYITKPFNIDEVLLSVRKASRNITALTLPGDLHSSGILDNFFHSKSQAFNTILSQIRKVADSKATVLIVGESGTGKELAAQALHELSSRKEKPLVKVHSVALPDDLLESELFGHDKGAFTGASSNKMGRFELADGGSIFLDEIGDIPPSTQVKLLRVLQEREFEHVGGIRTIRVDVRIVAATNRDLEEQVAKGNFRNDLYYRLNVIPIKLPPLRERKEDIASLVGYFLNKSAAISGLPAKVVSETAMSELLNYSWPGNIRELENVIERCVLLANGRIIERSDLPESMFKVDSKVKSVGFNEEHLDEAVDEVEKDVIIKALKKFGGNRTKAAIALGISRRSLQRRINKYIDDVLKL